MAGLKDILKKVGLCPMKLESGGSVNTMALIEAMFEAIVDECRKGGTVRIKDFGTFSARMNKGRTLKTPLMEDGEVKFGDILLMKFHQSSVSKQRLNQDRAVESWGGTYVEKKKRPSDIKKEEAAAKKKAERAAKKKANAASTTPKKKSSSTKSTSTKSTSTKSTSSSAAAPPKKKSSSSKKSGASSSKKKSASTTTDSSTKSPPPSKKSGSKSKSKSKK